MDGLDDFTRHYLIAALWSSTGDDGEPMDHGRDLSDIAPETITKAVADCCRFQEMAAPLLAQAYEHYDATGRSDHPDAGSPEACAGHDFWLNRAGHGVGFWDRDMGKVGDDLSALCKAFPAVDLYVGDDGLIYSG